MKNNVITINRKTSPEPTKSLDFEYEELYHSTFFDIVMNAKSLFNKKEYSIIMNSITPAISLKYTETKTKQAETLIKQYLSIVKSREEKEYILGMRDTASSVDHIFKYYLNQFQEDKKESGFDVALDKNQDFYFLCEDLYKQLPTSFVFSLINIVELLKNEK